MNILVLNGSPKGKASATLHTALYLEALHPEHTFEYLPVGVRIKSYEKDFAPARAALEKADLVLFCYPVYTFLAPYQLHRFVELMKENGPDLAGKFASQITTSKHFYDVTARRLRPGAAGLPRRPARNAQNRGQRRGHRDRLRPRKRGPCRHDRRFPGRSAPCQPGDKPAGLPLRGRVPGVHELRRHRQVRL